MIFLPRLRRAVIGAILVVSPLVLGGCVYGFSGGGGLPDHIQTVAVPPVENETPQVELTDQLFQSLLETVRGRLGAQLASEGQADAIVRATITGYDDQALNFQARQGQGAEVFQRRVTIRVNVEIYDVTRDQTLWSSSSVTGAGEYAPADETDAVGRQVAIQNVIDKIVNGAQSQW